MLIEDTGRTKALLPENAPRRDIRISRLLIALSTAASVADLVGAHPLLPDYVALESRPTDVVVLLALSITVRALISVNRWLRARTRITPL